MPNRRGRRLAFLGLVVAGALVSGGQAVLPDPGGRVASATAIRVANAGELGMLIPEVVYGHRLMRQSLNGGQLVRGNGLSDGLRSILDGFGRTPDDLSMAFAFDPTSESDLRIHAIRVVGVDARLLLIEWLPLIHGHASYHLNEREVGGKPASCISTAGDPLAFCYVAREDVLFVAISGEFLLVREAIAALP